MQEHDAVLLTLGALRHLAALFSFRVAFLERLGNLTGRKRL
jgi:hypothetical protein